MFKKINIQILSTIVGIILIFVGLVAFVFGYKSLNQSAVTAITSEGVVSQMQTLNRLETMAFSVDTVITAQKEGNWYKLWQDEQKGLFVARGRVVAGVDLSKLTAQDVQVSKNNEQTVVNIKLPNTEILAVYLDDIQLYDWQTGVFGLVENDPEILKQVQTQAKIEVLNKACAGDIMTMATTNAKEHIGQLFGLMGDVKLSITMDVGKCQIS